MKTVTGSYDHLTLILGCKGKGVLYVGDDIFGDIQMAKSKGWRTLLIIPELEAELCIRKEKKTVFTQLNDTALHLGEMFR